MKSCVPLLLCALAAPVLFAADPLPSWNDTAPKRAVIAFVEKVTKKGSTDFVPPTERIATFDNDGCLWAEQPMYFQAFFIIDRIKAKFESRDGKPVLVRLPEINFIDDKAGKPVAIQHHIGRRPVMAFGNSDGDLQMLQWTAAGPGPYFCLYVHHDDAEREWAYDRESSIGRLDQGLDEGLKRGWTILSMKRDWAGVFPD